MWERTLLEEMGHTQLESTTLGEDNMSTIAMINIDCNGQKTKHIVIQFNLIREQVKKLVIVLQHLKTQDMISDILTKPLDSKRFYICALSCWVCWCIYSIPVVKCFNILRGVL